MDKECLIALGILAGLVIFLVAMLRNYKVEFDRKRAVLEKNDREHEQKHNQNCQRIEKLEEKNGEIERLKKEIAELKARNEEKKQKLHK